MKRIDLWAYLNGVEMDFSRPGKPAVNPFIEAFNGGGFQRAIPARVPGRELGSCPWRTLPSRWNPGEDTTMGRGTTLIWETCRPGGCSAGGNTGSTRKPWRQARYKRRSKTNCADSLPPWGIVRALHPRLRLPAHATVSKLDDPACSWPSLSLEPPHTLGIVAIDGLTWCSYHPSNRTIGRVSDLPQGIGRDWDLLPPPED